MFSFQSCSWSKRHFIVKALRGNPVHIPHWLEWRAFHIGWNRVLIPISVWLYDYWNVYSLWQFLWNWPALYYNCLLNLLLLCIIIITMYHFHVWVCGWWCRSLKIKHYGPYLKYSWVMSLFKGKLCMYIIVFKREHDHTPWTHVVSPPVLADGSDSVW